MNNMHNSVQLIGHLGRNPQINTLANGNKVAKLLLATSSYKKNEQGQKETSTTWHNLVAWGNTATLAEKFLIKGKKIAINGSLNNRMYTDKDGIKRYYTEIVVSELQMVA